MALKDFFNKLLNFGNSKRYNSNLVPQNGWQNVVGVFDNNGYVDAHKALGNSDIYSVVSQISGVIASASIEAYQTQTNNDNSQPQKATIIQNLLDSPTSLANRQSFWQSIVANAALNGNSYAYIWRNANGVPVRFEFLRQEQVSVFRLFDGSGLVYNITFDEPNIGTMNNVSQADVLHFRLFSENGGITGRSPLLSLINEMKIKDESDKAAIEALENSANISGVLKTKLGTKLDDESRAAIRDSFVKDSKNGVAVLDDLADYTPIEIKSSIANLLNQTSWTSEKVAEAFNVPSSFINGKGDQQSSIQMETAVYDRVLNDQYARPIASELNAKLGADIRIDLRRALDPSGTQYAATIADYSAKKVLAPNQAVFALQQAHILPADLPDADWKGIPSSNTDRSMKGGDK